jgi:hypothetical protein
MRLRSRVHGDPNVPSHVSNSYIKNCELEQKTLVFSIVLSAFQINYSIFSLSIKTSISDHKFQIFTLKTKTEIMNWKAVILATILHNFFSWPFIYCCTANNDLSRLKNINSVARLDADKGLTQLIGAISFPLDHVGLKDKHSPCTLDRNNHIYSEEKGKRRRKRRIMSAVLRRMKRYPIHLDPLFQYRYLTRSGRKYSRT